VISRADMAERGVPPTTVNGWYRNRARTGHPEMPTARLAGGALLRCGSAGRYGRLPMGARAWAAAIAPARLEPLASRTRAQATSDWYGS
jgi:hypothetical protein